MDPDDFAPADSTNSLIFLRKHVQKLFASIPDTDRKSIKSLVEGYLRDALPIVCGFLASGSVGEKRYDDWRVRRVADWFELVNQSPWIINLFGGPLGVEQSLIDRLSVILDALLADLGLIAAGAERQSLPDRARLSDLHRLALLAEAKFGPKREVFEANWTEQSRKWCETFSGILLGQHVTEKRQWRIVFRVHGATEWFRAQDRSLFDVNDNSPFGKQSGVDLLSFRSGVDRSLSEVIWATCFESIGHSCDARSPEFDACFFGDEATVLIVDLAAHPAALASATDLRIEALSGFVGLTRQDCAHGYSVETSGGSPASNSFPLHGVAIDSVKPKEPALLLFSGADYPSVRGVTIAAALLPFDEIELGGLHELVANNPITELIVYSCLMPGSIPVSPKGKAGRSVERIRKALQFWSRAELLGARLTRGYLTPWRVADVFLEYCTVLEILLGSGSELSEIIASRAAGIVATVPEKRVEMRRTVKELYGLRSKFVHEGSYLIRIAELREIREIVRRCLLHSLTWLTVGSERLLREEPNRLETFFETVRVFLDSRENFDERRAIESLTQLFAEEDFGEYCDLLRFGNNARNDR